jgi:hypothetical protein
MKNPPELASARVSRRAAVWAAVITVVGGFATAVATGAIGLAGKAPPHPFQRWIRIDSVELAHDAVLPSIDRVRLVAQVNGISYSYPTSVNSIWAPVGPGMMGERYPLLLGAEVYRIKLFGFGLTADGKIPRYEFRGVVEYPARQIPLHNATQALQRTSSEPQLGLTVGMTVHYSIE